MGSKNDSSFLLYLVSHLTISSERPKVPLPESRRSSVQVDLKLIDREGAVMAEGEGSAGCHYVVGRRIWSPPLQLSFSGNLDPWQHLSCSPAIIEQTNVVWNLDLNNLYAASLNIRYATHIMRCHFKRKTLQRYQQATIYRHNPEKFCEDEKGKPAVVRPIFGTLECFTWLSLI